MSKKLTRSEKIQGLEDTHENVRFLGRSIDMESDRNTPQPRGLMVGVAALAGVGVILKSMGVATEEWQHLVGGIVVASMSAGVGAYITNAVKQRESEKFVGEMVEKAKSMLGVLQRSGSEEVGRLTSAFLNQLDGLYEKGIVAEKAVQSARQDLLDQETERNFY